MHAASTTSLTVAPKVDFTNFRSSNAHMENATERRAVIERLNNVRGASNGRAIVGPSELPVTLSITRPTEPRPRPRARTPRSGSTTRDATAPAINRTKFGTESSGSNGGGSSISNSGLRSTSCTIRSVPLVPSTRM